MFKKILATALTIGLMAPSLAFAQSATSSQVSAIQALLQQIIALQAQLVSLQQQKMTVIGELVTTLKQGDQGENVKILQQLLAQDPSIYPEGKVTGFFGPLTVKAIKRFQGKNGIEQVGNVGPKTLKRLNELFGHGKGNQGQNGNSGHNDQEDNDGDNNDGIASTTPGVGKVSICHKGKQTIYVGTPAMQAHLNHGDSVGQCAGTATTTPPVTGDVTAPVISGVNASNIGIFTANINWTTNEGATSQVEYGATNLYGFMTTLNSSLVTSHTVALSGLSASTTVHFRVISKDSSNNSASSSDMTFTTTNPDTTTPVISGTNSSNISSTTATVGWSTDESATGKVYYSTTNPVDLLSALSTGTVSLSTSHLINLIGLTASTTYFYVVESKDASNNTATSSQLSFLTL